MLVRNVDDKAPSWVTDTCDDRNFSAVSGFHVSGNLSLLVCWKQ